MSPQHDDVQIEPISAGSPSSPVVGASKSKPNEPNLFVLQALGRADMEKERLNRISRKRHSYSEINSVDSTPAPKKARSYYPLSRTKDGGPPPFINGVVKRTWVCQYPRQEDDIKIEEVLQKDYLQLALLSSFQWDDEWMMSKIDSAKTKLLLLAFAADDIQKSLIRANAPCHVKFCFPPMHGFGSMHSKLMVLKFRGYLRIVIPTGNLVPYDWGETGVMENMLFLIDLPRLDGSSRHISTQFSTGLMQFLHAAGVEENMVNSLAKYDFSKTDGLRFVYTIPGCHSDGALKRIGYCGLGASVTSLGLRTSEAIEVDVACASLGSLTYDFIAAIYGACRGSNALEEYVERMNHRAKTRQKTSKQLLEGKFRIYFPTKNTVIKSRGGKEAGGTICMQSRWWRSSTFPVELVQDCVNTKPGLLMHTKVMFVRRSETGLANLNSTQQTTSWAYIGSANLSESAWGRLGKDRLGKMRLTCRNWECGVVIPVSAGERKSQARGMDVFKGTVPIPMEVPGPLYGPLDTPWFSMEN